MTFSEAFYGTYKLDKKDGKPHLKERIFAPVDGFWSGVMIFGGVVGTIILLLTFAAHVQVALGTFAHPAENGALTPDAQYTLWSPTPGTRPSRDRTSPVSGELPSP